MPGVQWWMAESKIIYSTVILATKQVPDQFLNRDCDIFKYVLNTILDKLSTFGCNPHIHTLRLWDVKCFPGLLFIKTAHTILGIGRKKNSAS